MKFAINVGWWSWGEEEKGIKHKKELGALIHHAAGFCYLMFVKKYFIGIS